MKATYRLGCEGVDDGRQVGDVRSDAVGSEIPDDERELRANVRGGEWEGNIADDAPSVAIASNDTPGRAAEDGRAQAKDTMQWVWNKSQALPDGYGSDITQPTSALLLLAIVVVHLRRLGRQRSPELGCAPFLAWRKS